MIYSEKRESSHSHSLLVSWGETARFILTDSNSMNCIMSELRVTRSDGC